MQDDDFSLFQSAVRGVRPISHDRADTGKPKTDRQRLNTLRQAATVRTDAIKVDGLSDQFVIDVGAEDELYWARHGMTVEKARETLWAFFAEAARMEVRCVRVTHGKAARTDGKRPMIKSHVNTWLRQHPQVLGFTSCLAKHGGTGAVYVLLKRTMMEGRDED